MPERSHAVAPTVGVRVCDIEADIDVEFAPLNEPLWLTSIQAWCSCQENLPGVAWIESNSAADVERMFGSLFTQPSDADGGL
ncbi:MAG: hypothetical protein U0992_03665 [Planctomycetaceae bacterium]